MLPRGSVHLAGGDYFKQARDLATSVPTHCTQKQETKFKQHRYASQLHFFFSSFESADARKEQWAKLSHLRGLFGKTNCIQLNLMLPINAFVF